MEWDWLLLDMGMGEDGCWVLRIEKSVRMWLDGWNGGRKEM